MNESVFPDIYFLPEWGTLFQKHDGGEVCVFDFENEKGRVFYQFNKRRISSERENEVYYDTVTVYGFNGPVVLKDESGNRNALIEDFNRAFQEYCMENKIVSEYIRFSPWIKNHEDFKEIYTLSYNNYTLYTDLSNDDFFNTQFCSKIRNLIRKSAANGVTVEYDFTGSSIDRFSELYNIMAEKNGISSYYIFAEDFLKNSFTALGDKQFIINAKFEGKTISSAMFLQHGKLMHYHLAANDPAYYSLNANSLILNEACKWGVKNNKSALHLGGAFSEQLFSFKKQFTKNAGLDFYVGKKIRQEEVYGRLVSERLQKGEIVSGNYFPLYRG